MKRHTGRWAQPARTRERVGGSGLRRVAVGLSMLLAAEAALVAANSGMAFAADPGGAGRTSVTSKASKSSKSAASSADSAAAALLMARLQHRKIEITSERTADSTTYALPNGQLQTAAYAGPIRVKQDGKWQDIDTSLSDTGSSLTPQAAVADITVSDGGDKQLASVTKGGTSFGLGWEDKLPTPKVKGDTASYDLGGGQTLTVSALAQGFSQNIVLDKAPGSAVSYRIPLHLDGLKLSKAASGHLLLKNTDGKLVAEAPAPMMWDSSKNRASGESDHQARVKTTVETAADGAQTLVLTPDASFLAAKDLTYPVTVDPTSTLAVTTDTWLQTPDYPDSQVSSTELKSGTYDSGTDLARSYLKFDVSKFAGKHITDTNLALYNYYSSTCSTAGTGTTVRRITTSWSSTSVTWATRPSSSGTGAVINTGAHGYSTSCPAAWSNWDIDTIVQAWADGTANYGLMLYGTDETDSTTWRRFRSANYATAGYAPALTVTYNSYPATPSAVGIQPSSVNAYSGKRYVTTYTATLSAKVTDPDGSSVKAQYEITNDPSYTSEATYSSTVTSASVASGSTATLALTSANQLPAQHLRMRVRGYDGTDYGAWSSYVYFVPNVAKPAAPTVSCDTYTQDSWAAKASAAVSCTLDTTATDGAGFYWGLDNANVPNAKLDTTDGNGGDAQTISIDPANGWHTLYVRTVDSGGNLSTATTAYSFGVGADGAAITSPADGADTARRLTLAAKGLTTYTGVTWQYRRGETDSWHTVPVGDVTASGSAVSSWPVAVTSGTATKLVWNVVSSLSEDGDLDLRAAFTDGSTTGYSQTVSATLDRDAGTAPTSQVGPGEVNLLTGDYSLGATDASAFSASVDRTYSSRANGNDSDGQSAIFGPGWVSSVSADLAGSTYTQIRKTSSTSVELLNGDGTKTAFTATSSGGWTPQTGAEADTLTGTLSGSSFTLTDTDGNVSVFAKAASAATTWTLSTTAAAVSDSTVTVASETVTSGTATLARPKYVISPTSGVTAATCQTTPSTAGCRVLEFVYASSTTATSSALGNYTGQVSSIKLWATTPGASAAASETVASYAYDTSGQLRQEWDPRISPALKTAYTYDSASRVATYTPAGQLPWTFTYGTAGSSATAGAGMLLNVSRPTLTQGSASTTNGTAVTTVVYDVPTSGTSAPYALDAGTAATWGQEDIPTDATAVFPADSVPSSNTGSALTASGYSRATVTYINANGDETNTAAPGGGVTTTEYDDAGNIVRDLSAANRALALGTSDGAADALAAIGISDLSTADRAEQLSTITVYSADGQKVTDEYGPLHIVTLTTALDGGDSTATLPAGTAVPARAHTAYTYDGGRPSGAAVSNLVTTRSKGAAVAGYPADGDIHTATTAYDWSTGQPTSTTGSEALTTVSTYDTSGRVATTRTAGSSGTDAGTLAYTYYTASGSGSCAARPEWAGLLCSTAPAAAITGGGSNPTQAVTTVYTYNRWGQPATKAETANSTNRTTTYTVDAAGRTTKTAITGGTGTDTPATTITYDSATGLVASKTANGQTITYSYDSLGRTISYTDGAGNTETLAYDSLDRPVGKTDSAPSTTAYNYDTAGNLKTLTDSVAGTFTGTYNADGTLTGEVLPGSYTLTVSTDPAGDRTDRQYTDSSGTIVASDVAAYAVNGTEVGHTQTDGSTTDSAYTYDSTGHLTQATDTTSSGCTTRAYTFDANSNRTALTTTTDDCDSSTSDATSATTSYTYDSADRLVNSGYVYDAFGRTTTSGSTALSYYTNDLVSTETVGTSRNTWALDAAGRLAVQTAQTQATDGTWGTGTATTNHYDGDVDTPAWTVTGTTISRNVQDLTGGLAAVTSATGGTTLQLATIHGDIMVSLPLDTSVASTVRHYDEYGNLSSDSTAVAYGSLGAYQRSSNTLSGITLMGVRLYNPTIGRFLSVDMVYGGNSNPYDYCSGNPVTCLDLSGLSKHNHNGHHWHYWGLEIDMTHHRATNLVLLLGAAAGVTTIAAALAGIIPGGQIASALLWILDGAEGIYAAWIGWYLFNYPKRGVYITINWSLFIGVGHE